MARLQHPLDITGSLAGLSFYKRKDLDITIVRTPGGASKKKVDQLPSMEPTRQLNSEFAGRSAAVRFIRQAVHPVSALADFNFTPRLNGLLAPVQAMDGSHPRGQRSVCLSKAPQLLEGFRFNQKNGFDDMLRSPVHWRFDASAQVVILTVPLLVKSANFMPPAAKFTALRFLVCAGRVPDMQKTTNGYAPITEGNYPALSVAESDWQPFLPAIAVPPISLPWQMENAGTGTNSVQLLSIGIQFGRQAADGSIQPLPYSGAGKVLCCVVG